MKRLGEFNRPLAGEFRYVGEDLLGTARHFGLAPVESWLAVYVRETSGRHYHIVRHFRPGTSPGVMAAVSHDDGIHFDPRKMNYLHGGTVLRHLDADGALRLSGSLGTYVGADGIFVGSGSLKSEATIGEKWLSLSDSNQLELAGPSLGPGHWVLLPWGPGQSLATMHTAMYYNVKGTAYGEAVQGIVAFENMWQPPGTSWGDSPINRSHMGLWCAFAQEFEDGTVQYGHLADWTEAGTFSNIVDDGRHITCAVRSSNVDYRDDGFADRIVFELDNGETWECVTDKNGAAIDTWKLAQSAGQTFRTGHKGYCGRVGETRRRCCWYGIFEVFPDRLRAR